MKVDDLMPYILAEVPGCPVPTVRFAIIQAASELCREAHTWSEIQDPMTLVDGQHTYQLDAPAGAQVVTVKEIWADNRKLTPVAISAIHNLIPNWQSAQGNQPDYYSGSNDWSEIRLYPIPTNPGGAKLTMRVAYQPKFNATVLPAFMVSNYLEAITAGAKSRLMMMPGRAWTSMELGGYNKQVFDAAITQAKIENLHDRVAGSIQVQPRRFGF